MRRRLLGERAQFAVSPAATAAAGSVAQHLCQALRQIEPASLGLYWPRRSEFNAAAAIAADMALATLPAALPFAARSPIRMEFRAWDGQPPRLLDDCGIPASDGPVVVPDVVVVPCVGFTAEGYRLGYGGGYFDRWLALHPATTTIGVAWSFLKIPAGAFRALGHDRPLTLMVTEQGVD